MIRVGTCHTFATYYLICTETTILECRLSSHAAKTGSGSVGWDSSVGEKGTTHTQVGRWGRYYKYCMYVYNGHSVEYLSWIWKVTCGLYSTFISFFLVSHLFFSLFVPPCGTISTQLCYGILDISVFRFSRSRQSLSSSKFARRMRLLVSTHSTTRSRGYFRNAEDRSVGCPISCR